MGTTTASQSFEFHNLPSDYLKDVNGNDGESTVGIVIDGEEQEQQQQQGGAAAAAAKKSKYTNENNNVRFDEFGRYIIEDYDAHSPFSDILPVSNTAPQQSNSSLLF